MEYDIAVIGGGPGGYVAAIRAAQAGARVCLIEKDKLGGTCLNHGCIPTKTLLKSVHEYNAVLNSQAFGIDGVNKDNISLNITKVMKRKNKIVSNLEKGIGVLLKGNKIDVIKGFAEVLDKKHINIDGKVISSNNIIIATGAKTALVPIEGLQEGMDAGFVISSKEALEIECLPKNLCIIGGGVIGVEMATYFNSVGVNVTVVELMPEILPSVDKEVASALRKNLEKSGINVLNGARVKRIAPKTVMVEINEGEKVLEADLAILSVGRVPVTKGLESLGLAMEKGAIVVNNRMETSVPGVYAIGDVIGKYQLAHAASAEGITAVENALGDNRTVNYSAIPQCIYTLPQIASVGMTEKEAIEQGYEVKVGKFPLMANSKAAIEGAGEGFVKVVCDACYGELLGIHMLGENVTEMIIQGAQAISMEATVEDVARVIAPHPSISESIVEAAHAALGKAIHII